MMLSLLASMTAVLTVVNGADKPHMVVIVADDLGWGDVSWRDSEMATPNLETLANEGVKLNQAYALPVCTPSRAAFLTGQYPFRYGLQAAAFPAKTPESLPTDLTILPQKLKDLGYSTHLVGKWHLGFCNESMVPTSRGFDTFYGMYLGVATYETHMSAGGYDLHDNGEPAWEAAGDYSTHLFTDRAIDIIAAHDQADPLFLVLSYQAPHSPLEVPAYYEETYCSHVADADRKTHCAMVAAMDEGIGNVTAKLTELGYDDNLIVLFTSDNGGHTGIMSSNWPLRGSKTTLWEGGTRVVSFLHSKAHLPNAPYEWDNMIHFVDWFPTLLSAAGDSTDYSDLDGLDQWARIKNNRASARTEIVYNINDDTGNAAIRQGNFKLVLNAGARLDGWYNPPTGETAPDEPGAQNSIQLFNVVTDPEETTDLSTDSAYMENKVIDLTARLVELEMDLVPTAEAEPLDAADPSNFDGAWSPGWC